MTSAASSVPQRGASSRTGALASEQPPLDAVGADVLLATAVHVPSELHSLGKTQSDTDAHDVLHAVPLHV
jgi:hypothetical protein